MSNGFFGKLADELPAIITRKDISTYFGSYISPKYLANLDSQKKGSLRIIFLIFVYLLHIPRANLVVARGVNSSTEHIDIWRRSPE